MNGKYFFHSLLVIPLLLAVPARAADVARPPLTLEDAIALGTAHNPLLRAAAQQIAIARAREIQAAAAPGPVLTLAVDQVPFANPVAGNYMASLGLPLLPGGLRPALQAVAALDLASAEIDLAVHRQDLTLQIKLAYGRWLYEHEVRDLARANEASAIELARATAARVKAGELASVELFRIEVERGRAQRALAEAEGRVASIRARLAALLGQPVGEALFLPALASLHAGRIWSTPAVLVARALARRLELRRADLAIRREGFLRDAAIANSWSAAEPSVALGAVSGEAGLSTTLSLPMPRAAGRGEVLETEAHRARLEAQREVLASEIALEVEQAHREAVLAAQQLALFATTYLPQAERLATNARRRFAAGEGSGQEVIEARRSQREVGAEHLQALLDRHQALARLERALGEPE